MLQVNNIEVIYSGCIFVLKGVSLRVAEGQIVSLLGANGAGKSTALKAISGLLKVEEGEVTAGEIMFERDRIDRFPPEKIARMGIIQVMEGRQILEHLTTEENLLVAARPFGKGIRVKAGLELVYDYFPKLKELRHRIVGYLSGGEQQMLVIGRALMSRPRLLMLDEPSLGLAPIVVEAIFEVIRKIRDEQNTAILLVEQNAMAALSIADYGYVMEGGKIVLDDKAEDLKENKDIQEFYLGFSELGRKSFREGKRYARRKRWLG